ncbi:carbohydrate kinase [Oceanobacillus massiliensis]|uniref:carbohydrate kinase family protein n=1 Tax=Oceanobacillus massiliensis TaxID=1465765 RepID=UPI0030168C3A
MNQGIISYGEAFVDYIAQDRTNKLYNTYLGGTTINVAVGARRLGTQSHYICKLGTDETSQFIRRELEKESVNTDYCMESERKRICSVYIHLNEMRERHFHAYINETPDEQLLESELHEKLFENAFLFYFGSGTLFHPTAFTTTKRAIQLAKHHRSLIAFDPNIRLKRWDNLESCKTNVKGMLPDVDILKISEEELLFLTEAANLDAGLQIIKSYQIPYVFITRGEDGAIVFYRNEKIIVPAEKVEVVDTTGAGDAFMAGLLHCFDRHGIPKTADELVFYTKYANKLGSNTVKTLGALTTE